ncbi:sensor histidine kinase [Urechidicola sp. KH5]
MRLNTKNSFAVELFFNVLFIIIIFLFYSFDRNNPFIELTEIVFFLNYAFAAYIINFLLFPKFFYTKKYRQFTILLILLIVAVILIEELVIEQIFYPDTRGSRFSNVLITLIDILPPIIIIAGFKLTWDAVSRQRELDELKLMVKESELQFLKTQINPHFLFNNLNNLYACAVEQSSKTPEIILALSSLLRYMLYECQSTYVSLKEEVEQLQNFMHLGKLQIEGRGTVIFKTAIDSNSYIIAPLILSVFIENAFKHSTSSIAENILIDIYLSTETNGTLNFICKNTYQKDSNTESLSKGIGLENVKKRLELIYPNSHELIISNENDLYCVDLKLQLQD